MAESLSNQMKELSLEPVNLLGESLETELSFCTAVKNCFVNEKFDQRVVLRFVYGKICINFFILSEKRLSESDEHKACTIVEKCFEQKNKTMRTLGWCANYKIDSERVKIGDLSYGATFSYINDSKACWTGVIDGEEDEVNFCKCFMCEFYG